ncbi:hypothetical protein D3C71_1840390 [compost metagenome]
MRHHANRIRAQPQVQRMAEADHAAIPQQQVQGQRGHAVDEHAAEQRQQEGFALPLRVDGNQRQHQQQGAGHQGSRRKPVHGIPLYPCLTGNRPCGRKASTSAITT